MFGMGWQEIAIVAVVLIVVVGPDDLPGLLRNIGKWVGSLQSMARDFRRQIDTMADDAGFAEERKLFDQARNLNPTKLMKDMVDPTGEIAKDLDETQKSVDEQSMAVRSESALEKPLWQPKAENVAPTASASPPKKPNSDSAGDKS